MVTSLLTNRRLRSWLSGAVLTTWSWTRLKQWKWSWTSGEPPPPLALPLLTIMNSSVTAVESFRFLGTTISQDLKWDNHTESIVKKGSAEAVLPSPAEKVQPATGAAETVLFCHHWIRPLHINNCLVQLSYQICPQKTTKGSPYWWVNPWYNPPYSPRTVFIQSEKKGWKNRSGPFTSSTLTLWTVTVWSTLQSSEHQNDQTQKQFLPSSNPSHEHLTSNVEHTTLLYSYLFTTLIFFHFKYLTHNCLYCILCFCTLPIAYL